jgi:hypothetical protein
MGWAEKGSCQTADNEPPNGADRLIHEVRQLPGNYRNDLTPEQ